MDWDLGDKVAVISEAIGLAESSPVNRSGPGRVRLSHASAGARAAGLVLCLLAADLNTNAVQTLTTSSGAAWLRPTAITAPRVLRIGARLEW